MAEIKSSGSSAVTIQSDSAVGVFGPWTALFMGGTDQASHPISFDSIWALLVIGKFPPPFTSDMNVEIGRGPTSPPAETVWGPMKYHSLHTGGGRGLHTNYSFPLKLSAGDQLWARMSKSSGSVGVQNISLFLTVSDQFQPVRPATVHLSTTTIFEPVGGFVNSFSTPDGVQFPGDNLLGLWYEMTTPNSGLGFNSSWMSIAVELINIATTKARWQLGSAPGAAGGGTPDQPELIDVGYQSEGGGGQHVSEIADVMNFPIPWTKGQSVWIRGAVFGQVNANPLLNFRIFKIAATFWGNP